MPKIVLATLNAKYVHASFGLRYLLAHMGELAPETKILEFHINQRILDVAERILQERPSIIGLGIYIWNAAQSLVLVRLLRKLAPDAIIVLGGPEVSYESREQEIVELADYVITGEADFAFAELCRTLGGDQRPADKIIRAALPKAEELNYPYHLYNSDDIQNRLIYVEASRGCPFTCEFCLSSLDVPVRQFPVDTFLAQMQSLYDRGARSFKFVDRTFNLNIRISKAILQFFLERYVPGLFVHFEMVPDRLPDALKEIVKLFPAGCLQFEVGIQSFNPDVGALISRRQDIGKLCENIKFLRRETNVFIHADLIAGLPGETIESFGEGFNRLVELGPQEIQVGILKRLRGTPIVRHDDTWQMVYNPNPPYELLSNKLVSFATMQRIGRFARFWELLGNSELFRSALPLLWEESHDPFNEFLSFSDWLYGTAKRRHEIALSKLTSYLSEYLTVVKHVSQEKVSGSISDSFKCAGRSDLIPLVPRFTQPSVQPKAANQ
ncbi:MAG: B12-binding domain-containing radical SAM protein [Deltaproteobacteria bacterium]|nr:B12-binding domain-containing radical SAM protein [Deltaproteobacteria bacterium]